MSHSGWNFNLGWIARGWASEMRASAWYWRNPPSGTLNIIFISFQMSQLHFCSKLNLSPLCGNQQSAHVPDSYVNYILYSDIDISSSKLIFLIELNQSVLCEFERPGNIDRVNLWGLLCLSPTLTRPRRANRANVSKKILFGFERWKTECEKSNQNCPEHILLDFALDSCICCKIVFNKSGKKVYCVKGEIVLALTRYCDIVNKYCRIICKGLRRYCEYCDIVNKYCRILCKEVR